jgi:hypothetical protein
MNIIGISRTVEPTEIELSLMGVEPPLNTAQFTPYFTQAAVNSDEKIVDYIDEARAAFSGIETGVSAY